jgi:hypothetical protein
LLVLALWPAPRGDNHLFLSRGISFIEISAIKALVDLLLYLEKNYTVLPHAARAERRTDRPLQVWHGAGLRPRALCKKVTPSIKIALIAQRP